MAIKKFNGSWVGVYRESGNTYVNGTTPIRAGSSVGYNSFIGFNSTAIRDAITSSKTAATVWLNVYVTRAGTMDFGMHRETTNKGSGTLPYYTYTGRSFQPVTGWRRYDITSFARSIPNASNTFLSALQNGYHGIVLYGQVGSPHAEATGSSGSNQIFIEVEGQWNTPPKPTDITQPGTGVTADKSIEIRWNAATDAETAHSRLVYELSYYDGTKWRETWRRTGITSYTYPLQDKPETSAARFRIRVYDGEYYSAYRYSPYFTVNHNKPPAKPTLLGPINGAVKDRTEATVFMWRHNDQDAQSKREIRYRLRGTSIWTSSISTTTAQNYSVAAGVLPKGDIEWQVQTFDQGGLASPWSDLGLFRSTEPSSAPTIVHPMPGQVVAVQDFFLQWSASGQTDFEAELYIGNSRVHRVTGTVERIAFAFGILENQTTYAANVRIKTQDGLWSPWTAVTFSTSFVSPLIPIVDIREHEELPSALQIEVTNPAKEGGDLVTPEVARNYIERRESNGSWVRLADDLVTNGSYVDATPAGGTVYEYRAVAIGENSTSSTGDPVIGSVQVRDVLIQRATDPSDFIRLSFNLGSQPKRSFGYGVESTDRQFSGRKYPVTEFGEHSNTQIGTDYTVKTPEVEKLIRLLEQREVLLYRDAKGRKLFVAASELQIGDELFDYHTVGLPMREVDYQEGVTVDD